MRQTTAPKIGETNQENTRESQVTRAEISVGTSDGVGKIEL
jgi:hypothetical protein